ncbi:hypothetical protein SAMN05660860_01316 [Geoalkalibacter ferrihydriticus]|uniref:Dodecin flavoprotein n=2 Tax=Geoalkalibacter ferrihydriticus TaxID=392333 RepID=A0A0C2HL57_9BACT|nr:dodecin [Geoalkalibacter ferrihydriticus]KIH77806.1 dodecin flavoprotein [Geoalkalibacter ferrihydriticus DSM 17813]SDL80230.1 hypothetical protein SAMN05660860_01316 [Geoalkalibacter ferrihydriticus]
MTYGEDRIYKKIEVIGISSQSIEGAVQAAVSRASQSLEGISWFEVQEVRGHVGPEGKVAEYQVVIKVSFELK